MNETRKGDTMDFQKDFAEKILNEDKGFILKVRKATYEFFQIKSGEARFIYAVNTPINNFNHPAKMIAVATKDKVYMTDQCFFEQTEWVNTFEYYKVNLEEQVNKALVPLTSTLPSDSYIVAKNKQYREELMEQAKAILISEYLERPVTKRKQCRVELLTEDVLSVICGFKTVEMVAKEKFEAEREPLTRKKTCDALLEEFMSKPLLKDWEIGIAKAIAPLTEESVLITLDDADTSSAGIHIEALIARLKDGYPLGRDVHSCYNIVKNQFNDKTCEDIGKITSYRGETLYRKSDYVKEAKRKSEYERE